MYYNRLQYVNCLAVTATLTLYVVDFGVFWTFQLDRLAGQIPAMETTQDRVYASQSTMKADTAAKSSMVPGLCISLRGTVPVAATTEESK